MILIEDNLELYRKAESHQTKKMEAKKEYKFDEEHKEMLMKGFDDADLVSLADSDLVDYDHFA